MDKSHWLEARRKGIGGSDAPAVCGVSPWKTPYQVWMEKTQPGGHPQEDNEPMFWGRTLEPVIRQRYADVTGRRVVVPEGVLQHPHIPWMLASVDGVTDDRRVVEIKTSRSPEGWGEPGTDEIPEAYLIQVQHYMIVTAYPVADVAVLIGGNDFRMYEIPADKELQDLIMEKEAAFWRMVEANTSPDPTTFTDLLLRFGMSSKAVKVQADELVKGTIHQLKVLREYLKEEEAMKAIIMKALGEADTLVDGDKVLATWKAAKGARRFDAKGFQEAHPDLYGEFLKESEPSRRLLIK